MKLGRQQQQEHHHQQQQRLTTSIRSKAAHFVTDLTTVILNPISDKPSSNPSPPSGDVTGEPRRNTQQCSSEEDVPVLVDGPDTSSFSAFLYSFLSPGKSGNDSEYPGWNENRNDAPSTNVPLKESSGKKGLLSRGKQSIGKALSQAARLGGYRSHASGKVNTESKIDDTKEMTSQFGTDLGVPVESSSLPFPCDKLPKMSEPSQLMTEDTRSSLYVALPSLSQGKKWVLLYSTWRHGISLSTLYRRSNLCPGLSLLVVGDRKGAVFGGLVEAPLRPSTKKRYQYLALGGGSHFAMYLDSDLYDSSSLAIFNLFDDLNFLAIRQSILNGSSLASETYGNSCLSYTEEFEVKEIELWGFVYASEYEDALSLLRTEAPGICR
ncbi:hypothetical protein OSB04_027624, partial [Centaurea solstitialis]